MPPATSALAKVKRYPARSISIAVHAEPFTGFDDRDPARKRFGAPEFRGGLELTSKDKPFGGISALHMATDGGRFVARTDCGAWLKGRIVDRQGSPASLAGVEMAPVLGAIGRPLAARSWYDIQSLTEDGAGHAYVGIEHVQCIVHFGLKAGLAARPEPISVRSDFKTLGNSRAWNVSLSRQRAQHLRAN